MDGQMGSANAVGAGHGVVRAVTSCATPCGGCLGRLSNSARVAAFRATVAPPRALQGSRNAGRLRTGQLTETFNHRIQHPRRSRLHRGKHRLGPFVSAFASPLCGSTPSGPRPLLSYLSILQTRIRQTRIRTSTSDNDKAGANH